MLVADDSSWRPQSQKKGLTSQTVIWLFGELSFITILSWYPNLSAHSEN